MPSTCGERRPVREYGVGAAAGLAALGTVLTVDGPSPSGMLSAAVAVAVAVWALGCWPYSRCRLAWPLAGASALSLLTTFLQPSDVADEAGWKLIEVFALLSVLLMVVRRSPRRPAVLGAGTALAAVALWTVPLVGPSVLERAGAALLWSLPALAAVVAGGYPRWAARRARLAVTDARRLQQLELARDLHDFVAHDVSAIVVQAQAARFVADSDPRQAVLALERIEQAGLSALASMDRTVRTLHEADGRTVAASAPPGAGQLPQLVERFAAERDADCRFAAESGAAEALSREAGVAAYRLVVEALTNIRRHAPGCARVEVTLGRSTKSGAVEVRVTNDAPRGVAGAGPSPLRRRGGSGLAGLRERVEAAGGRLTAASEGGGWRVAAVFPEASARPSPEAASWPG
ncbi:histidine kinase [Streptomyces sp. N2-109]|uniref:histidine kinase n=1 Tax=Streptomyces gossypii TaxID=2883101 RepID=A0ABT2JR31_9ACTN|nr:histidine kinase [Streptomyces gossypii]MCT2590163.1 histidine kinase [Streptomyces gossypii]